MNRKNNQKSKHLIENSLILVKRGYSHLSPYIDNSLSNIRNIFSTTKALRPKDLFTTKCEIPVFIVPTGLTSNEYKIYADFSIYEKNSHSAYKIPIPQIEVYSAYSFDKFDKEIFKNTFILTFTDHFHSSMKNIYKDYENAEKIEKIKLEETKKEESTLLGKLLITAGAVGAMAVITNPIIDLLFLLIALGGGYEGTKEFIRTIKNDILSLNSQQSNVNKAFKKDIKEIKAKEVLVRKALSNIKPIIHPGLIALQNLIKDKSNKVDSSTKQSILTSKPSLLPILSNGNFLSSFPHEIKEKIKKMYNNLVE